MRVLVCGGRDYDDWGELCERLALLHADRDIKTIIHGGACGADRLAGKFARESDGIEEIVFPADWNRYGVRAGPIRNRRMLDEGKPDLVVAFRGGRGTADMIRQAKAANVPVQTIK
jgi:predicted Rossmann-fold nucleotide-binding protein